MSTAICNIGQTPPCGLLATVTASIYNPSIVTLSLNNLPLIMSYKGVDLGLVSSNNFQMIPGNNILTLTGIVLPKSTDLNIASQFFGQYLTGITSLVSMRGYVSNSNLQNTAASYTINSLTMETLLQGLDQSNTNNKLLKTINIQSMGILVNTEDNSISITGNVNAIFQLPYNLQMTATILSTAINFNMLSSNNKIIGSVIIPSIPVQHNTGTGILSMSFNGANMNIKDLNEMQLFASNLLLTPTASFKMDGAASETNTNSPLGLLIMNNIPAKESINLQGFNQFLDYDGKPLLKINRIDILNTGAGIDGFGISASLTITNRMNINNSINEYHNK